MLDGQYFSIARNFRLNELMISLYYVKIYYMLYFLASCLKITVNNKICL